MQTERFHSDRKDILSKIFDQNTMVDVWRKIVKQQLRQLDLKDLYDHYDFNFNLEDRVSAIRKDILNGTYKASQPLIYRLEKKFGICRHIVIPQPIDALVLQVLVEYISDSILQRQPSKNVFYSRDRHRMAYPHQLDDYNLTSRQQWKNLQKKIYNFQKDKELLVVTDLANYYDSISLQELRKVLASYAVIDEVTLDILFRIFQEISWSPDYLPFSQRGLPTTNIEGVRLVAHAFLFEIDGFLEKKTEGSFTRWMDDITIGVNDYRNAVETLSSLSDILKSRGLALNLAKTNIYDQSSANYHFQIEVNKYIDQVESSSQQDPDYKPINKNLHSRFLKHLKDRTPRYWDKVAKRYITTYTKFKSKLLLNILPELYVNNPTLRQNLLYYLADAGYTKKTGTVVIKILESIDIFDDISLHQLCVLVTEWMIPIENESKQFLKDFEVKITAFTIKRKMPFDFYSILWFKAKYNHPEELLLFIEKFVHIWQLHTYLRRQATAILSRVVTTNSESAKRLLNSQISSGVTNTVTLANQIYYFQNSIVLLPKVSLYLFPQHKPKVYELSRFLVLCSVLNSESVRRDENVRAKVREHISDPYYRKWLESQYNIQME